MEETGRDCKKSSPLVTNISSPDAPPLPGSRMSIYRRKGLLLDGIPVRGYSCVATATRDLWERMFNEGYRTDVAINTDNGGVIHAHASILGMASPVMKNMLKQSRSRGCRRSISIRGVPHPAVRVFIRFLYSSCYEQEEMNEFILPLLVLSHGFVIPSLKRECERQLQNGLLNIENVVDIFQLSLLCDAPRLSLFCHRLIIKSFMVISTTEGWKAMKQSHPMLEKELLESVIDADSRKQERLKKIEQRKIYLQLYEAMEALVHICRDGCRTIGPHDKVLKGDQPPCNFAACKGLELLVRHFAGCKLRVPGGCIHCKRMWQLLELHSRLCSEPSKCKVPLCRNFKERLKQQSKKDEVKWKLLVQNILRAKKVSGASFFSPATAIYA
ncbi:zinc finger protein [Macleaya cordata]|uniref:Zinc finger protein n=1 Tax=Macleaya cordata TaxID=56857 RepID=A0A200QAQ0_MACCD|nr:zinc finger protein [Macleaya cordata]